MNRPRKKGFLVYTTSDNPQKQAIADRNKNACKKENKNIQCMMSVLGKQRQITLEEYFRLKKAGYKVDVVEVEK